MMTISEVSISHRENILQTKATSNRCKLWEHLMLSFYRLNTLLGQSSTCPRKSNIPLQKQNITSMLGQPVNTRMHLYYSLYVIPKKSPAVCTKELTDIIDAIESKYMGTQIILSLGLPRDDVEQ